MLRVPATLSLLFLSSSALAQNALEPFRGSSGVNQRVYRDTRAHVPGVVYRNVPLFERAADDSGAMVVRMGDFHPPTVVEGAPAALEEEAAPGQPASETPRLLSENVQAAPDAGSGRVTDGSAPLKPGQFYLRDSTSAPATMPAKSGT